MFDVDTFSFIAPLHLKVANEKIKIDMESNVIKEKTCRFWWCHMGNTGTSNISFLYLQIPPQTEKKRIKNLKDSL